MAKDFAAGETAKAQNARLASLRQLRQAFKVVLQQARRDDSKEVTSLMDRDILKVRLGPSAAVRCRAADSV